MKSKGVALSENSQNFISHNDLTKENEKVRDTRLNYRVTHIACDFNNDGRAFNDSQTMSVFMFTIFFINFDSRRTK